MSHININLHHEPATVYQKKQIIKNVKLPNWISIKKITKKKKLTKENSWNIKSNSKR